MQEKLGEKKDKCRLVLVSIFVGMLSSVIMIVIALAKDDTIGCKIIYDFDHDFDYEPYLFIEGTIQNYEISPHSPTKDTYDIVWTMFEEYYEIPYKAIPFEKFSVELLKKGDEARICSIEFYKHGYQVLKYSPSEINYLFDMDGMKTEITSSALSIKHNTAIILQGNDLLNEALANSLDNNNSLYLNSVFWGCCIGIIVFVIFNSSKRTNKFFDKKKLLKEELALVAGLVTIFILVFLMALFSKHYSHPDEPVSRMAIDYYLSGWRRPDMSSSFAAGTFSIYGSSRLSEPTMYYLFAGKIGWIFREFFNISAYYRMFNVLLLGGLLLGCWKNRKNHGWMLVAICMTPQIWYLYSYATSDAWDWFCGFVMIFIILKKEDYLFEQKSYGKLARMCLKYGLVFAMILLGKSNYYVLLLVAFIDFLLGWIQRNKNRIQILVVYFIILGISFGVEYFIEHIPTAKSDIIFDETYKEKQIDISEERKEQFSDELVYSPKNEGVSFWDMLWHYSSLPTSVMVFCSATGCYMWMGLFSGRIYYIIMVLAYFVFVGTMFSLLWKNRKENPIANWKLVLSFLCCCITIAMVFLYCWVQTYQPQGRYLLMIWLILGYMCAQCKDAFNSRLFKGVIVVCTCMGIWSFAYYGLFAMFQKGYLFTACTYVHNIICSIGVSVTM